MARIPSLSFLTLGAIALCGCISPDAFDRRGKTSGEPYMLVNTSPQGAQITFDDGVSCITPCRVLVAQPLRMRLAKAGYRAGEVMLTYTPAGTITYRLEQAAPITEIEQSELPDL